MARKTFISYKYNEARGSRDLIIRALGENATYYTGETSESPNMDDLKTDTIKEKLKNMIFPTSVMIVIISKNVDDSKWMEWEINYATSRQTRNGRQSQPNGIVKVMDGGFRYVGEINELIERKSKAVTVDLMDFLRNPNMYIEEAYSKTSN